jgi:hypothetical protein
VRGTLRGIEVERWGSEQAHQVVGSLKPLQDLHTSDKELSRPASALVFFVLAYSVEALLDYGTIRMWLRKPFSPLCNGADDLTGLRSKQIRF